MDRDHRPKLVYFGDIDITLRDALRQGPIGAWVVPVLDTRTEAFGLSTKVKTAYALDDAVHLTVTLSDARRFWIVPLTLFQALISHAVVIFIVAAVAGMAIYAAEGMILDWAPGATGWIRPVQWLVGAAFALGVLIFFSQAFKEILRDTYWDAVTAALTEALSPARHDSYAAVSDARWTGWRKGLRRSDGSFYNPDRDRHPSEAPSQAPDGPPRPAKEPAQHKHCPACGAEVLSACYAGARRTCAQCRAKLRGTRQGTWATRLW
ncbi:MAG: hypothetical protein KDE22_17325 [Rhodobacterales bacterium]|nr:hypothetical protein [Rhodobacterales bacterium]